MQLLNDGLKYFHSMSFRVLRSVPPRGAGPSSQQKKMVLEVDLNVLPSDHSHSDDVGASIHAPVVPDMRAGQQRTQPPPITIDLESIDDDVVVLSSPRAFAVAKNNNTRRSRSRNNVVDVESVSASRDAANSRNKRQRVPTNQPVINCESYVDLERSGNGLNGYAWNMAAPSRIFVAQPQPPPPPPAPEPTFSCPVCMGILTEEMSTKCGHIFCKACIKKAITCSNKCPTCRRKLTQKDTIRIYLPKTS